MENNKINIAELLKDCPTGMELDCTIYENCEFLNIDTSSDRCSIRIKTPDGQISLNKYGCYHNTDKAKCVIFPKGKTTWEDFVPPIKFEDGDIVYFENKYGNKNKYIGIFRNIKGNYLHTYIFFGVSSSSICFSESSFHVDIIREQRFATEEEKVKLFNKIKEHGYTWNAETKTLEELVVPKFKVGDKITDGEDSFTIDHMNNECYYDIKVNTISRLFIKYQDNWELVPNKFDISTLTPFESRVLVRDYNTNIWKPAIFGDYIDDYREQFKYVVVGGTFYKYLIPYEGNEHLRGKTDDCDEYYKVW